MVINWQGRSWVQNLGDAFHCLGQGLLKKLSTSAVTHTGRGICYSARLHNNRETQFVLLLFTQQRSPLSSRHSGQNYRPQIAFCLTHPKSLSESHKTTVVWDGSPKTDLSLLSYLSTKIKVITTLSLLLQTVGFQAGFVPSVAWRSTVIFNQRPVRNITLCKEPHCSFCC